jgi:DNA-binding MarR family transcriptional regulator
MSEKSELPIALRSAYLAMHRLTDASFAKYGVTADQFVLLATLSRGDALTQRELARRMSSDPSTVRAMLILLEKKGFVEREVHPSDSRSRTVALTVEGKRMFRQLWNESEQLRKTMLDAIGPADAAEFIRLLNRLAEALNSDRLPSLNRKQRSSR